MDKDTRAARAFYEAVAAFSKQAKPWDGNAIYHAVLPDEKLDPTLISRRVYGRPDEYLAVLAAADVSTFDEEIPYGTLVLPREGKLTAIKRQTNFESLDEQRDNGAPVWSED